MTSIEWLEGQFKIYLPSIHQKGLENAFEKAKEIHKAEQENLYTEEQVREALFFALNVNRTTCCTTRTTDSIVRETIQSLNVSKGNATSDFDKPFIDFAKQYVEQLKIKKD